MKNMIIILICFGLLIVAIGSMGCLQEQKGNTISSGVITGSSGVITGNADGGKNSSISRPDYTCALLSGKWGQYGYQKCTLASGSTIEWPILTRYNKITDKYDPYGFDSNPHCEFPGCNENSVRIDYNEYAFEITARDAATVDSAKKIIDFIESYGYKVDIYNDINRVITDGSNPNVQIVNNFRVGEGETNVGNTKNSIAHFIFPPHFSKKDNLPILVQNLGSGSTPMDHLYKLFDPWYNAKFSIKLVLKSKEAGRTGIIGVIPSAGGQGSQGHNEESLDGFAEIITYLKENFNADNNKIVMFGGSRGGGTTLIRAANPRKHDYNVIALFADSAPVAFGSMSLLKFTNFPHFDYYYPIYNGWLYYPDYELAKNAWKYNSKFPPNIDLNGESSICKPLVGTSNINEADAKSVIGYADYEHFGGKYMVIGFGTQDATIPYHLSIKFDEKLKKAGVLHKICIALKGGHEGGGKECMYDELEEYVLNYLTKGKKPELPDGRYYYISDITKHTSESASYIGSEKEGMTLPFTAIIPSGLDSNIDFAGYQNKYINKQEPADIILIGAKGKSFKVHLLDKDHKFLQEWKGIFGEKTTGEEYHIIENIQFNCSNTCDYYWKFWFDGKEISSYNTPFFDSSTGNPKEVFTKVITWQPHDKEIVNYLGQRLVNMGIVSLPTCGNDICEKWENNLTCFEDCK